MYSITVYKERKVRKQEGLSMNPTNLITLNCYFRIPVIHVRFKTKHSFSLMTTYYILILIIKESVTLITSTDVPQSICMRNLVPYEANPENLLLIWLFRRSTSFLLDQMCNSQHCLFDLSRKATLPPHQFLRNNRLPFCFEGLGAWITFVLFTSSWNTYID